MTYTYTWADAEQTCLKRECSKSDAYAFIPASLDNRDYREFLESGATAADYVAPPEPAPLTAEEKLSAAGLTVAELRALLAE